MHARREGAAMTAPVAPAAPPRPATGVDLARAVLLFWAPGQWTEALQETWCKVTGTPDDGTAKSVVLVRMAAEVLAAEGRS